MLTTTLSYLHERYSKNSDMMAPYRSNYKNAMNSLANTLNKEELLEK